MMREAEFGPCRKGACHAETSCTVAPLVPSFGCGRSSRRTCPETSAWSRRCADRHSIGFIYVGPKDDYGYNQAHAEGAAIVKKLPGVTLVEEENVPETVDAQKTMESMINLDGATLLFPTSFGYFDPHVIAMAKKHPKMQFRHCGGLWKEGTHPGNAGSYFGYIGQGQYLNGIAAAHATKTKKIGFVAAKPIPQACADHLP
jgi:basic membrane lipoprotein Med (substrate-binding protein (PBP1-ABC) superfamily)